MIEDRPKARYALRLDSATIAKFVAFSHPKDPHDDASAADITGEVMLRNARIGQLIDSPAVWKCQPANADAGRVPVALDGCTYGSLGPHHETYGVEFRKRWLASGEHFGGAFAPQPYTQLAKVMHDAGHERQARAILIEREDQRLRRLTASGEMGRKERWWQLFIKHTLGFGYQPWKMLYYLLAFWVIGTLLFDAAFRLDRFAPAVPIVYTQTTENFSGGVTQRFTDFDNDLADHHLPGYPRFFSPIYSLDTLVPLVNLHQETHWMPHGPARWYMWLHISLGWVGTTLFVAGFTSVVRRD